MKIAYESGLSCTEPEVLCIGGPVEAEFTQHDDNLLSVYLTSSDDETQRVRVLFTPEEAAEIGSCLADWGKAQLAEEAADGQLKVLHAMSELNA